MIALDSEYIPSSRAVGVVPSALSTSSLPEPVDGSELRERPKLRRDHAAVRRRPSTQNANGKRTGEWEQNRTGIESAFWMFEKAYAEGLERTTKETMQWARDEDDGDLYSRAIVFAEAALDFYFTKAAGLGVQNLYVEAGFLGPACERGENEFVTEICYRYYRNGGMVGWGSTKNAGRGQIVQELTMLEHKLLLPPCAFTA